MKCKKNILRHTNGHRKYLTQQFMIYAAELAAVDAVISGSAINIPQQLFITFSLFLAKSGKSPTAIAKNNKQWKTYSVKIIFL